MTDSQNSDDIERDNIIRKIAALLARAEDKASSAAEIAHAIAVADKLMRRHNLSRDEVRMREEEFRRARFRFDERDKAYAGPIATAISRLAQCHIHGTAGRNVFVRFTGMRVDVDYAEWLLRATWAAMRQGWDAYKASAQYKEHAEDGTTPRAIEHEYKLGFTHEIVDRIRTLARRNAESGADLIAFKNALIEQEFGEDNGKILTHPKAEADLKDVYRSGAEASRAVPLRHELRGHSEVILLASQPVDGTLRRDG